MYGQKCMDEIDLFASRLNCQMKSFISWHPDPKSFAVDAFTENWGLWMIFVFPPFSLIQRVLSKVERDQATGLLIVPHWPTAVWYPQMLRLLIQEPVMFPCGKRVPTLKHTNAIHPLHRTLQLLAVFLSGKLARPRGVMEKLWKLCAHRGEIPLRKSTRLTSTDKKHSVLDGTVIPFVRL